MNTHTCFVCNKEIVVGVDRYTMVAIEIPYVNLFFHKECYINDETELEQYLHENSDKVLEVRTGKQQKKSKNAKKRRKKALKSP